MEEVVSRTHAAGRRMATLRTATTTRRGVNGSSTLTMRVTATDAVSPARWGGVVVVIGALVSAVILALVSPAESGSDEVDTGPVPAAALVEPAPRASGGSVGPGVPAERPLIGPVETKVTVADDGVRWTRERELALDVTIPTTELRPKQLRLVALVDGHPTVTLQRPRGEMTVTGIPLAEGLNTVTLQLASDTGEGPASDALIVALDTTGPEVVIRSPKDNAKLSGETITVTGAAEVGSRVTIANRATGDEKSETVGPSGNFEKVLRSAEGPNRIIVAARDAAGNVSQDRRTVTNAGTKAALEIDVRPHSVKVRSLPRTVRLSARVADAAGKPIRGAAVTMTLGVPGGQGTLSYRQATNREGLAKWSVEVHKPVSAGDTGTVTVVAKLPDGRTLQESASAPAFE